MYVCNKFFKTNILRLLDHVGRWNFVWKLCVPLEMKTTSKWRQPQNEDDLKWRRPKKWRRPHKWRQHDNSRPCPARAYTTLVVLVVVVVGGWGGCAQSFSCSTHRKCCCWGCDNNNNNNNNHNHNNNNNFLGLLLDWT